MHHQLRAIDVEQMLAMRLGTHQHPTIKLRRSYRETTLRTGHRNWRPPVPLLVRTRQPVCRVTLRHQRISPNPRTRRYGRRARINM